jgi:hypothetical protein
MATKTGRLKGENKKEKYENCISSHYACCKPEKGGGHTGDSAEDACRKKIKKENSSR